MPDRINKAAFGLSKRGVSGSSVALHDQEAVFDLPVGNETQRQYCHTTSTPNAARGSRQLRLRLSQDHARRWLLLPPYLREHAADVVFGTFIERVNLEKLVVVHSELKQVRLFITNLLEYAVLTGVSLDVKKAGSALDRISSLLGEKL